MKAAHLFFFLLILPNYILAQSKIFEPEKPILIGIYNLSYQPDSLSNERKNERMILTIGKNISSFESMYSYKADSIIGSQVLDQPLVNQSSMNAIMPYLKTNFKYKIYKNYHNKNIYYYDKIITKSYNIEQNNDKINWVITDMYKKINNYNCQKATTNFAGRKWVGWFTKAIPISDGPYKFMGLPGLIIEIYDTDDDYHFLLNELKKVTYQEVIKVPLNAIKTNQVAFNEANSAYYLQGVIKVANNGNPPEVARQLIENYKKKQLKKNNPIELK
ncbi:GLPGLI family protein [Hymenobacter psychrophilus]|uniref:GLPGLI family protein n=1 Tax=Hymenobacter psychrophilus TaxID=651662 RepID=A0A1H3H5B7_9BACT|nr:GLPGLI family protein [Hymenobacter psychrophilus]SDY09964.1 GLPGLI family protein [Hymenobacter psychrophilus]